MRASLAAAGIFGVIVGLSTWVVVRLQREEIAASKQEFERYKLGVEKDIAEANARTKQAELELQRLKQPRTVNPGALKEELEGKPKAKAASWAARLPGSSFFISSGVSLGGSTEIVSLLILPVNLNEV
jgi:hypothetical protein